jgi:hypothetical protein
MNKRFNNYSCCILAVLLSFPLQTLAYDVGVRLKKGHVADQKKNYSRAVSFFRKEAIKGHPAAQSYLGIMYAAGQGLPQDYGYAVTWYRRAADQGDPVSQYNLGKMYKKGQGVNRYYDKSAQWYQKAADQGHAKANNDWSKNRHTSLSAKISCLETSKTRLFSTAIKCADRNVMMTAIKAAGVQIKAEDKSHWGDTYLTTSPLLGFSELYIAYTLDNLFAMAQYTFGSKGDLNLVSKIRDIVVSSYGQPDLPVAA